MEPAPLVTLTMRGMLPLSVDLDFRRRGAKYSPVRCAPTALVARQAVSCSAVVPGPGPMPALLTRALSLRIENL